MTSRARSIAPRDRALIRPHESPHPARIGGAGGRSTATKFAAAVTKLMASRALDRGQFGSGRPARPPRRSRASHGAWGHLRARTAILPSSVAHLLPFPGP